MVFIMTMLAETGFTIKQLFGIFGKKEVKKNIWQVLNFNVLFKTQTLEADIFSYSNIFLKLT